MWVVIGRSQCNFCDTAKALLKAKGYSYVEYSLTDLSSRWLLHLVKQAGYTTVPQIFKPDGTHIGGYTELKEYLLDSSSKV
jgi:glutaredoxin 3